MPKFFVDSRNSEIGDTVIINGNDAFHISRALRMAKGEHIAVVDLDGMEHECVLCKFNDDSVEALIISSNLTQTESPVKVYLFQALPKGDKLETVIQKSVECGVFEIVPFESKNCVVKAKPESESKKTERRNRIALEAVKQCGRAYIPRVSETVDFHTAVDMASKSDVCIVCYEGEEQLSLKSVLKENLKACTISVMIGSEGGFSAEEIEYACQKGFKAVSLGKRILRSETVSAFVLGCIAYEFEL